MKKFYYLLASIVLFIGVLIACTNPSIEAEELQAAQDELLAKPLDKVEICHYDKGTNSFHSITINGSALQKHLDHNDKLPSDDRDIIGSFVAVYDNYWLWEITINNFNVSTGKWEGTGKETFPIPDIKTAIIEFELDQYGNLINTSENFYHSNGKYYPVNGKFNRCGGVEYLSDHWTVVYDEDEDGYYSHEDCDDTNALINPGVLWYLDSDGDGYGDPNTSTTFSLLDNCDTSGYVTDNTDCDDNNDATYPGAEEICDGEDNDCDGETDEGVKTTFYQDIDGDGFGNPAVTEDACDAPVGYVTDNTDCDDTKLPYSPEGTYKVVYPDNHLWIFTFEYDVDDKLYTGYAEYYGQSSYGTVVYSRVIDQIEINSTGDFTANLVHGNGYAINGSTSICGGITNLTSNWSFYTSN